MLLANGKWKLHPIETSIKTMGKSLQRVQEKHGEKWQLDRLILKNSELVDADFFASSVQLLPKFSCITVLHLIEANLQQFPSTMIRLVPELIELNLNNNCICELPDDMDQILSKKLKKLNLSKNLIKNLPLSIIELFKGGLKEIDLQENYIELDKLPRELKDSKFNNVKRYWHNQNVAQEIIPRLYLGSAHSAKNRNFLKDKQITHILSMNGAKPIYPDEFTYKTIAEEDQIKTNLLQHFNSCFEFIDKVLKFEAGSILIHCAGGRSRSATIVIAYIMHKHKLSFEEAFNMVQDRRCCIMLNPGFVSQLKLLEKLDIQAACDSYRVHIEEMAK
jgi:protein-tyrosine phosphatase